MGPLLANLYMRRFVLGWKMLGLEQSLGSRFVTYADDLCAIPVTAPLSARCRLSTTLCRVLAFLLAAKHVAGLNLTVRRQHPDGVHFTRAAALDDRRGAGLPGKRNVERAGRIVGIEIDHQAPGTNVKQCISDQ